MSGHVSVEDGFDVREKCEELGIEAPEKAAFLPRNFEDASDKDDLVLENQTATYRKVIEQEGVEIEVIGDESRQIAEKSHDTIIGILFFSAQFMEWEQVSTMLDALMWYLERTSTGSTTLKAEVGDEDGNYQKLEYEGPADEIPKDTFHEMFKGEYDG